MNNLVFIGIIVLLIAICVYIYLTKNSEIDELTKENTQDTSIGKMVDINDYNNCMNELNNLRTDLRQTQEENYSKSMNVLDSLLDFTVESQETLSDISS